MRTTKLRSITRRPQVVTLPVEDLSMLVRFAVLMELQDRRDAPASTQAVTHATFVSYAGSVTTAGLESCWPLLRSFASDWIRQQQRS